MGEYMKAKEDYIYQDLKSISCVLEQKQMSPTL